MKSDGGTLIVFEGIDGSGKTTHIKRLFEQLQTANVDAAIVSYRAQPWFQTAFMNQTPTPDAQREAEFFAWAFNRLVDCCINPLLSEGKVVLVDRYFLSYFAYQSFNGTELTVLASNLTANARRPDLVIVLDVSLETAVGRCRQRTSQEDHVELVPFQLTAIPRLQHVVTYFRRNPYPEAVVIPEDASVEEAAYRIRCVVERLLKL